MSDTLDASHPSPHRGRVGFSTLVFGAAAAPIFWLGQLMLGYGVTAFICYPGDHPRALAPDGHLQALLIAFDVVALLACLLGGGTAWWCWRQTREEKAGGNRSALHIGEGRARFLALWGMMSSLGFFGAILFDTIASVTVPPCLI